jgi:hypothetical protein
MDYGKQSRASGNGTGDTDNIIVEGKVVDRWVP